MSISPSAVFTRDRFTWLAYLMLAFFSYLQAIVGPLMPFLRDELHLNYSEGALHSSALAIGMIMSGFLADGAVRRWGRWRVFWGGGAGMALGALILAIGMHPAITIAGAWMMGFVGTFLITCIQSGLADRHGPLRTIALTESNVGASIGAGLAPLLVGGLQRIGIGWRSALYTAVLVWAVAYLVWRRDPMPLPAEETAAPVKRSRRGTLPRLFWIYWATLVIGVAIEWSFVVWGADYMTSVGGLRRADASMLMSLYFLAMVTGRFGASRLSRRIEPNRLLRIAIGITLAGFLGFWIAPANVVMVAGLFVAGLGVCNLFPLLMSLAVGVGADHSDEASGRVMAGAGVAIFGGPQILGAVADEAGIQAAYGIVGVLLLAVMGMTTYANRAAQQK
ncbi:MFS transporter [Aggregatilinea lenta]|uniref:MFS transporter n=1 Tax=Aggregatilinea lenta TaxID=913108 RepID=UPI000E5BED85|nr:MFS transporter [Aggregatilinea lenta]